MEHSTIDFLNAIRSGLCNVGVEIDDPIIKEEIRALDEAISAVKGMQKVKEFRDDIQDVLNDLTKYEYAGAYTDGKRAAYEFFVLSLNRILGEKE